MTTVGSISQNSIKAPDAKSYKHIPSTLPWRYTNEPPNNNIVIHLQPLKSNSSTKQSNIKSTKKF